MKINCVKMVMNLVKLAKKSLVCMTISLTLIFYQIDKKFDPTSSSKTRGQCGEDIVGGPW